MCVCGKAGFKVFGKEALALLSFEISRLVAADGAGKAAAAAAAGSPGKQAANGSERVARALLAAADGNTGVEVISRSTAARR
eukprot:COSAG03_NODE_901_length_5420_cov_4.340350_7_plen_82_part_00